MLQYAYQHGCEWGPHVCSAAAEGGNLSMLKWLRKHGCPWDCRTNAKAAVNNHLGVLKWARQQQPPCPWWDNLVGFLIGHRMRPSVLAFLRQHQAPLDASHRVQLTEMKYAVVSLRAALPDRTLHEVVLAIVNLAFS